MCLVARLPVKLDNAQKLSAAADALRSLTSNLAKIRSHFALSRNSRHEPPVKRRYGASRGSGAAWVAAREARYVLDSGRCIFNPDLGMMSDAAAASERTRARTGLSVAPRSLPSATRSLSAPARERYASGPIGTPRRWRRPVGNSSCSRCLGYCRRRR